MDDMKGRVWRFGDDVDTDLIVPGQYLDAPINEMLPHVLESANPRFASGVRTGDLIVAGKNFGSGSSREQAPLALKAAGIVCVVAESFARIFFRNAIAIGLPIMTCQRVSDAFSDGQKALVSIASFQIRNLETGAILPAEPLSEEMITILRRGGILNCLETDDG